MLPAAAAAGRKKQDGWMGCVANILTPANACMMFSLAL
jgi:hypothetical protein